MALLVLAFVGCAQVAANQRLREIGNRLEPLMGRTEAEVVFDLGAPSQKFEAAGITVYRYVYDYGARASAHTSFGVTQSSASRVYDQVDVTFVDGRARKWRAWVQR